MRAVTERLKKHLARAFEGSGWGFVWLGGLSVLVCLSPGITRGFVYEEWTSLGRLSAGLALLVVVAGGIFAASRWGRKRDDQVGRELRDVFEEHGLELQDESEGSSEERNRFAALGRGGDEAPEVVGEWRGLNVRVRRGVGDGERSVFEVDVSGEVPSDLVIRHRSLRTPEAKYVGFEEVHTEDPRFDRRYLARAREPDRGKRALEERGLEELFGDELVDRAPNVHLEEGRLRIVRKGDPEDAEVVARRLDALRAATQAFVRRVDEEE
jgi:hypothetical protein